MYTFCSVRLTLHSPDFDLDLAYAIGNNFGKEFQTWVQDNPNKGAKLRVSYFLFVFSDLILNPLGKTIGCNVASTIQ